MAFERKQGNRFTQEGKRRFSGDKQKDYQKDRKRQPRMRDQSKSKTENKPTTFHKGIICNRCKKEGHYSYQCKLPKVSKGSSEYCVKIYSIQSLKDNPGLREYISVDRTEKTEIKCLPDTGADMSVICWSIVQKIGAVLLEHDIKSVKLA
ncbi:hypothetical protein ADUPG1_003690, partial [Aduncisulcus paluster]